MAGPKSKQTIEIETLFSSLDNLLYYAEPIAFTIPKETDGVHEMFTVIVHKDVWLSFRAAVHRAEKVIKPVQV
jgi:hypothetical protein